jgi:serine protease inhibitor
VTRLVAGPDAVQAEARQAESVDEINAWAARVTKGLITKAVPPEASLDDGMVLINAVYFKVRRAVSNDELRSL